MHGRTSAEAARGSLRPPAAGPARRFTIAAAAAVFVAVGLAGLGAGPGAGAARADADLDRWVEWHVRRATQLDAEGRQAEASEEWVAVARLRPTDLRSISRAAVALVEYAAGPSRTPQRTDAEYQAIERLIVEAMRLRGAHDPGIAYTIGRLRFADGDYEKAEDMLGQAVRRGFDPVRARLWHGRAVISDATRLVGDAGNVDLAVRRLLGTIQSDPSHPDILAARINLALAYRARGEQVLGAQILEEVLRGAPWNARAHLALAETYADLQRREDSAAQYKLARETATAREDGLYTGTKVLIAALRSEAQVLLRYDDLDACARVVQQFLQLQPEAPFGIYIQGMILLRRGDAAGAVVPLRRARRLDRDNRAIGEALIQALTLVGEDAEAESVRREVLEREQRRELERKARGSQPR